MAEKLMIDQTVPTLAEIFGKLYPSSNITNEERILLEGMLCGMVARLEKENEELKTRLFGPLR